MEVVGFHVRAVGKRDGDTTDTRYYKNFDGDDADNYYPLAYA